MLHINIHVSAASAVCICISFFAASNSAFASSVEVLTNGGFESGDLTGWSQPTINPNPWAVISTNAHTGTFSAYNPAKDSAIASVTLYQSFAPTPVTSIIGAGFWYFDVGNLGTVGLATLLTFSDGTSTQDTLFANDPTYKLNEWSFRDLGPTLRASSGKSLVQIGFFPKFGGSQYIDDVSVTTVIPEPDASCLCATGLMGLFIMAKRRRP